MEAKVKRTTDNVENLIKELEKQYVDNKPDKKEIKPSKYDEGTGTFYVDEELAKTKMEKKKIPEIVKKEEAPDVLGIEEGKDLATLLTCTPYGINTQRLILTGKRVPYSEKKKEAIEPEMMSWRELLFTALPFLIVFMLIVRFILNRRKERKLKS